MGHLPTPQFHRGRWSERMKMLVHRFTLCRSGTIRYLWPGTAGNAAQRSPHATCPHCCCSSGRLQQHIHCSAAVRHWGAIRAVWDATRAQGFKDEISKRGVKFHQKTLMNTLRAHWEWHPLPSDQIDAFSFKKTESIISSVLCFC